jgi:translation initiation factor 3 subunit G
MATTSKRSTWGDIEEEAEESTGTKIFESPPDENGVRIRTEIEYSKNAEGKTVKTTKIFKVYTKTTKINKRVQERRKWSKFGDSKMGEEGVTILGDVVNIETAARKKKTREEEALKASEAAEEGKAETWKSRAQRLGAASWDDITGRGGKEPSEAQPEAPSNVYVPRSLRGSATGGAGGGGRSERDDQSTVRVTNLSEDTREDDLRELFRRFGPIQRIYLAKDRSSGLSRGFAFVTFMYKEDAAKAIEALSGYGYDHLILNVEWAKPSKPF